MKTVHHRLANNPSRGPFAFPAAGLRLGRMMGGDVVLSPTAGAVATMGACGEWGVAKAVATAQDDSAMRVIARKAGPPTIARDTSPRATAGQRRPTGSLR